MKIVIEVDNYYQLWDVLDYPGKHREEDSAKAQMACEAGLVPQLFGEKPKPIKPPKARRGAHTLKRG
jgi:hypothetical protein